MSKHQVLNPIERALRGMMIASAAFLFSFSALALEIESMPGSLMSAEDQADDPSGLQMVMPDEIRTLDLETVTCKMGRVIYHTNIYNEQELEVGARIPLRIARYVTDCKSQSGEELGITLVAIGKRDVNNKYKTYIALPGSVDPVLVSSSEEWKAEHARVCEHAASSMSCKIR